jgi:hypothetical protein
MFIGHFALGFAAKQLDPRPSLATYFLAAQLPDVLWPVLLLTGAERVAIAPGDTAFTPLRFISYPISHSLLAVALWGALLAAAHWLDRRSGRAALLIGLLVVSHWVLDFVSHRPDLRVVPWSPRVFGLGLWNSVPATLAVELAMFAVGVWLYLRASWARDAAGRLGVAGLVGLLLLAYLGAAFGPPPPSVPAVALAGILGAGVIVAWAAWLDGHREARD